MSRCSLSTATFGLCGAVEARSSQREEVDMENRGGIRRAQSCAAEAREAAREFHAEVAQPDMALVMFFCSSQYDLDVLAAEMARLFSGTQVVGCTTAGEIGPAGYRDHSLSGASLPAAGFTAATGRIDRLQQFELARGETFADYLVQRLERVEPSADADNSFGLMLIDGLSVREEPVARALQSALGGIPLIGGSAGDGVEFAHTYVYCDGAFHEDSAVLALVTTQLPFKTFKTQHFVPADARAVVTAADAERRIVTEIDGLPAAEEFARIVGADVESLDPMRFAANPMVVVIDGTNYVRSIQKANPDGSLTFFCAIEEGLVLRAAAGVDLVEDLDRSLAELKEAIGRLQLVVGCDCILRKLEINQRGLVDRVEASVRANHMIGLNTYGEQYGGVHVNQTLTGIAIGTAEDG
jgi:hypothetical protein